MADPTLAELAARVAAIETRLGITPPGSVFLPAAPTGLRLSTLADRRLQLDWDAAPDATSWDVLDLLDTATPLKETVTVPRSIRSAMSSTSRPRRYAIRAKNAAGNSPLSAAVDVGGASIPNDPSQPPASLGFPADVFGKNWYLTLPTSVSANPDTVKQPALATYSSKYCELVDGAVVFRCWHGGATTSGSSNPRSELREENGSAHASWSTMSGHHRMTVEGQVNRLTKVKPLVVIAQIHDAADDVTVFRVEGDKLWLTAGDTPHGYLLDGNFQLGKRYSIGFDVHDGVVSYTYNGQLVPWTLKAATSGCYYKCGNYLQSNPATAPTESTSEYAEVVLHSVTVEHS